MLNTELRAVVIVCISFQRVQIGMALITAVKADIGRIAEYGQVGLEAAVLRLAASCRVGSHGIDTNGPHRPLVSITNSAARLPRTGHSRRRAAWLGTLLERQSKKSRTYQELNAEAHLSPYFSGGQEPLIL